MGSRSRDIGDSFRFATDPQSQQRKVYDLLRSSPINAASDER